MKSLLLLIMFGGGKLYVSKPDIVSVNDSTCYIGSPIRAVECTHISLKNGQTFRVTGTAEDFMLKNQLERK